MAKAKTFIVYDDIGYLAVPRLIVAENSREARAKYIERTTAYAQAGRKRAITVLRDTKRNRRNLGLQDKQEQKPSPVRTRQIAELQGIFEAKRTQ